MLVQSRSVPPEPGTTMTATMHRQLENSPWKRVMVVPLIRTRHGHNRTSLSKVKEKVNEVGKGKEKAVKYMVKTPDSQSEYREVN